ncbi:hypothetical protein COLO4_16561 [Corchorus olitorius]|uniref:Uncharacterized protein n=1 Tax=Corchorus olitorius TaxID=93759 RepID=A0A1R3JGR7_9ROSI|nr:hypothetical protein COLO4_16561 [Corchorus olitorius]
MATHPSVKIICVVAILCMSAVAPRAASASAASECSDFAKAMEHHLCHRRPNVNYTGDESHYKYWSVTPCAVARRFKQGLESEREKTTFIPVCRCAKNYLNKRYNKTCEAANYFTTALVLGNCLNADPKGSLTRYFMCTYFVFNMKKNLCVRNNSSPSCLKAMQIADLFQDPKPYSTSLILVCQCMMDTAYHMQPGVALQNFVNTYNRCHGPSLGSVVAVIFFLFGMQNCPVPVSMLIKALLRCLNKK